MSDVERRRDGVGHGRLTIEVLALRLDLQSSVGETGPSRPTLQGLVWV